MPEKARDKSGRKKTGLTSAQKSRRTQQILFGVLALLMVFIMVISLIVR